MHQNKFFKKGSASLKNCDVKQENSNIEIMIVNIIKREFYKELSKRGNLKKNTIYL